MSVHDVGNFFDNLAPVWDEFAPGNPEKIEQIMKLINVEPGKRILDVGTGTGVLIPFLLKTKPEEILAIDVSEKMIEHAKNKFKDKNLKFKVGDFYTLNAPAFDYIFFYQVYPHLEDKEGLVKRLHDLLLPGGRFIIVHPDNKENINARHQDSKTQKVSTTLESAYSEAKKFIDFFRIDTLIDTDDLYILSGRKF